jgi:hypothetical protein
MIGLATPPYGLLLFVVISITRSPVGHLVELEFLQRLQAPVDDVRPQPPLGDVSHGLAGLRIGLEAKKIHGKELSPTTRRRKPKLTGRGAKEGARGSQAPRPTAPAAESAPPVTSPRRRSRR